MNLSRDVPVVSSDAGDISALKDPNSAASIMKKAKGQEVQSAADMKYDATPPPPVEGFQGCVVEWENTQRPHEIIKSLFLASSVLLFLYAVAPEGIIPNSK
jgi:hypothetical protein